MCDCPKHHDDEAACTCVCDEHHNFDLALKLAFDRYDEIVRLRTALAEAVEFKEQYHAQWMLTQKELDAHRAGVRAVIDGRWAGDFAPLIPKLRALLDQVAPTDTGGE